MSAEQARLDAADAALLAMRTRTEAALAETESAATEVDSEVARFHLERRLRSIGASAGLPAFGRIDGEERWYVGRRHIEDDHGDPLVVDWRAPVSIPFYRATVHDPLELRRRRRFLPERLAERERLLDILEEDFEDPDGALLSGGIPDPLLAELERERTDTMRDIVATIASEQDEVIRTPLDRLLTVQGGPGTGKTAVALHRAAFLLFEHRLELIDSGVLVVGPNPVFLRYVADVLPSLGETAVRQTTLTDLRPAGVRLAAGPHTEAREVLAVKGDERMVAVVDALVRNSIRLPTEDARLTTPWGTVVFRSEDVVEVVDDVLGRNVDHATGREAVRNLLLHRAYDEHERVAEVPAHKADFVASARAATGVRAYVDRLWPKLSAPSLLQRLHTSSRAAAAAAGGILAGEEIALLRRSVPDRLSDIRWLPSDVPLLDELEHRLSGVRHRYGHVIVDEAQDLSPMELRMLARRSSAGSVTVVGDLAQATAPAATGTWDEVVRILREGGAGHEVDDRLVELTVGYRTPAPILDLANRLLPSAAPGVTPARSIRRTGSAPDIRAVEPGERCAGAARAIAEHLAGVGTTAVVVADGWRRELIRALDDAAVPWSERLEAGAVAVLSPVLAKGLEFDAVVVLEPSSVVAEAGVRGLFVALTRPTRSLTIVHADPLPEPLVS